jgi:succinate dehydrogenase flavin-adding protein (antitoxin of CptAB toxin-antitoxin module)
MSTQQQVQQRINFLQKELDSLEHYLPDTYQFLMAEMDNQLRELVAIKIQDFYQELSNEQQNQNPPAGNPT